MENPLTPLSLSSAIHIGASSISLLVSSASDDSYGEQVEYLEKSTSIGHDIFNKGEISRTTIEQAVTILNGYNDTLLELGITIEEADIRIVASNIVSESSNKDIFINRIQVACGIAVEVLDDGEMTRLIYMKTRRRLRDTPAMKKRNTLVVHAGPGTTRVIYFQKGKIDSYHSYRIGSHRLAEAVRRHAEADTITYQILSEQIRSQLDVFYENYMSIDIDELVLIGYEVQLISPFIPNYKDGSCTAQDLKALCEKIAKLSLDEVVAKYKVSYHTAESLVPALVIHLTIAQALEIEKINIPGSDYERGLLQDLHYSHSTSGSFADEVTGSAWALAKKFRVNKKHAKHVTAISLKLFDNLQPLHQLDSQDRLLLHCAALLHESGGYISERAHHKHSQYLILHSDIFGLSFTDIQLIALIARYHRNSPPKPNHAIYRDLSIEQQMRVSKLASILRVADSLDRTHSARVQEIDIRVSKKHLHLSLKGVKDASVERLALKSKGNLFQNIFGLDIIIHEDK